MDWKQKLHALSSIADVKLIPRNADDWYVSQCIEITSDGSSMLLGSYGNGATPIGAIEDHWKVLVEDLEANQYLVFNAMRDRRKHFKWNNFMWRELPIKKS